MRLIDIESCVYKIYFYNLLIGCVMAYSSWGELKDTRRNYFLHFV